MNQTTNHIFEHLVPQGTSTILIPFMVVIETIRNLIRPGTLAVRLTANIIAGHLLLTLLGNNGPSQWDIDSLITCFDKHPVLRAHCHHATERPQVSGGGGGFDMQDSCKWIE
jgi:hypothetical protein